MVYTENKRNKKICGKIMALLFMTVILFGCGQQRYDSADEMINAVSGTWKCEASDNCTWVMIIDNSTVTTYSLFSDGTIKFKNTYDVSWNYKTGDFSYVYEDSDGNKRTIKCHVEKSNNSIIEGKNKFSFKKVDDVDAE